MTFRGRTVHRRRPASAASICSALAAAARDPANLPDGMSAGLDADAYNDSDVFTFPNGCHAAEVEIDPETGAVTLDATPRSTITAG